MSTPFRSSLASLQRRLPAGLLTATFGLALAAAVWADVLQRQSTDREAEILRIHRENSALARAFEEHVRRVMQTADNALLFMQHEYEDNGRVTVGMIHFVERIKGDPILRQIAVADSRGDLLLSAIQFDTPVNISHREHFQVHATGAASGLYVGKPVRLRASEAWSFFLTRRLSRPDGSFDGIVSVGLNPSYFSEHYDTLEIGPDRAVIVVGQDGIVRARRFQQQLEIGQDLSGSPMLERFKREPVGHYELIGSGDSPRRFGSYRALPDFPLIVAVSELASSALVPYHRRAAEYRLTALYFSLFVAIFCLVLVRAERRTRRDNSSLTTELTERRKAEEALHESQGLFAAFLDHIPAVVFVQDLQGAILYSNQAFKDLPGREAIGRNARELLAPGHDGPPGSRPTLRGRSVVLDEPLTADDGQTRIFETRMFIVDRAGKEPLLGCVSVDGTGRRRAEEERLTFERRMQQTQKLESLGVLAGGIAHDFNNLLMVILGNADLALSKSTAESPVRAFITNIDLAAQRAADLANQMLAYSGKGRFLIEPINLSRLVEEMGHLLASVISNLATVNYRCANDLPLVLADATQLRQVVMNLITNASDALADRPGVITIATGVVAVGPGERAPRTTDPPLPQGNYVFIEVSDTGSGMDRATQARIFDPFFSTKKTGRGLGLASVLGIIRGHHGDIRVSSKPGGGTTFTVLLPTASELQTADVADAGTAQPEDGHAARKRAILLVDDEENVLQTTRSMLEESGFNVVTAADGIEGVDVFRNQAARLNAVVLDMNMPRMGGAAAFRQMQRIAPEVPVILTSGFDEQDDVSEFTSAGLADFIQKPFRLKTLLQKIEAAIAARTSTSA